MKTRKFALGILFFLASLCATAFAQADRICRDGACFPNSLQQNDHTLFLKSTALYRFWGFRVYTAALYTLPKEAPELFDSAFALSLYYHREITKEDFKKSSYSILRRNPAFEEAGMSPELNRFLELITDVKEGQVYTLFWDPNAGLKLSLDGNTRGTLEDLRLARLYLQIWLSDYSVKPENYRALIAS
jgi:hypothetical protein